MKQFFSHLGAALFVGAFALLPQSFAMFTDVKSEDTYGPSVLHLQQEGIVEGFADGTFRTQSNITRAEYTKVLLYSKYGEALVNQCDDASFPDVEASAWYYNVICYAKQESIVSGYADGTFHPNDNISYAEAAKILVNIMIANTDDATGNEWWTTYTGLLEAHGALPPTIGVATNPLSRGEMAYMASRMIRNTTALFIEKKFDNKLVYLLNPGTTIEELQTHCAIEGGTFNTCGSVCATDAEMCVKMCGLTCENIPEEKSFIRDRFTGKVVYQLGEGVTEAQLRNHCALEGGTFSMCSSSCAPDAEVCTLECAVTCENIPARSTTEVDEDTDTEEEEPVEEAAWKNYTNYDLGFRVNYPTASTMEELNDETNGDTVTFMLTGETQEPDTEITDGFVVSFDRVTLDENQSLSAYVDSQINESKKTGEITKAKERYELANKDGFRYIAKTQGDVTHIYLPINANEAFVVSYSVEDPEEMKYQNQIDEMLTSLQLIEWETTTLGNEAFTLKYPTTPFTSETSTNKLTLTHNVAYQHADVCDAKGDAAPLDDLTDFDVSFESYDKNLADTVTALEPTGFADENLSEDKSEFVAQDGFIEQVTIGKLDGWRVISGAEGCGEYRYYFPIAGNKTLVVRRAFVPEFSDINANQKEALAVEGALSPAQADAAFDAILKAVTVTENQ